MPNWIANPFSIDEEKRLAYRQELKRKLAELSVKSQRISELRNIVSKLHADSDRAAEQHGEEAGRLQSELDGLDSEQIECVLDGTKTPAKSIARRGAILGELSKLNQILETTCEANRRAARPIKKQIDELHAETADETVLRNKLAQLCSPDLRRARLLNGHRLQWVAVMLKDAQRMVSTMAYNQQIAVSNHDGSAEAIKAGRLADWKSVAAEYEREVGRIHEEDSRIQAAAVSE